MKSKVLSLLVIAITFSSCLPANIIVTGKIRPTISKDSVKIYNSQTIPGIYEIIGKINAQSESTLDRAWAHERNMDKLLEKAANVGANGLLIDDTQNSYDACIQERYVKKKLSFISQIFTIYTLVKS